MKKLITICAAIFMAASFFAQAPDKMSYQAVIRDGSNALVTSTAVGMQISILQGSASGTAVYVETQTPTTNVNGLASVEIGSGTLISGTFSTIDWANGPYFIKTETDPTGSTTYTITGTSELLSVPYALHAKTVEIESDTTHWKENSSNIYYNQGNVGIGTALLSPINKLTVAGTGYETRLLIKADTSASLVFTVGATKNAKIFQNGNSLLFGADGVSNIGSIDLNAPGNSFNIDNAGTFHVFHPLRIHSGQSLELYNATNTAWATFYLNPAATKLIENYTLEISNGDVFVSNNTKGIILTSPNGTCYRVTVGNTGSLITTAITCP